MSSRVRVGGCRNVTTPLQPEGAKLIVWPEGAIVKAVKLSGHPGAGASGKPHASDDRRATVHAALPVAGTRVARRCPSIPSGRSGALMSQTQGIALVSQGKKGTRLPL